MKKIDCISVHRHIYNKNWHLYVIYISNLSLFEKEGEQKAGEQREHMKPGFSGSEYLRILGRFCVRAGTPVEMEKCTSSRTESDTRMAELMTTAPPTKPNTNSSMQPGFMALRWHGGTPAPRRLRRGRGGIFVSKVCHSAAATKTMPSAAAAFHSSAAAPEQWHHRPPPPRRSSQHRCSSAEAQPARECFSLLPRRVHRLQSSQICIIYSQRALRTSGYHARTSIALHTKPRPDRGRARTAADIFPACPNANTPKSWNCLRLINVQSISQRLAAQQQKPLSTDFYAVLLPHSNHTTNLSDSAESLL